MKKSLSLRLKIILILLLFQIPLLIMSIFTLQYIVRYNNNRILDTVANTVAAQIKILDKTMEGAAYAVELFSQNPLFKKSGTALSAANKTELQNTLDILETGTIQSLPSPVHYFVHNNSNDQFFKSNLTNIDILEKNVFHSYLKVTYAIPECSWQSLTLYKSKYFLYAATQGDFVIGVLINCDEILESLYIANTQNAQFLILDTENQCISRRISGASVLISLNNAIIAQSYNHPQLSGLYTIQSTQTTYGFSILSATNLPSFFTTLSGNPYLIFVILYFLITVPILFFFLRKEFLSPINYLLFGFSQIENGALAYRAQEQIFSTEFRSLNHSFNAMVRQIKELRMDYYEEKIRQQEAENRYLRTISYPHFMLNNLNLINNFAYQKNESGIHEAILNLSAYLRHFVTASSNQHTLAHDIQSAKCYLNLNQLAYPERITYTLNYDENLLTLHFPPLIVSTIVENCIKHGLQPDEILDISLSLTVEHIQNQAYLTLAIRNTGPAFPSAIITAVNNTNVQDTPTEHIGLINIKQTLFSAFGESAQFRIENLPDSVLTFISVPMEIIQKFTERSVSL